MHCISTRDLAALAYERGEEFDPALMPTPDLVDDLGAAMGAMPLTCEPGSYELRRRRERERRMLARVPEWFSVDDLVPEPLATIHGELVWAVDPQANIEDQTTLARAIVEQIDSDIDDRGRLSFRAADHVADLAGELAERVLVLDEWRRAGGFDPYG